MSEHLNVDKLEELLESDCLADAVADGVTSLLRSDQQPELLCNLMPEGSIGRLEEELCVRIQLAICKAGLPMEFARVGGEIAGSVMSNTPLFKSIARRVTNLVIRPMSRELEDYIINDAHDIILNLMDRELMRIANSAIDELSRIITQDDEELKALIKTLYIKFMSNNARALAEEVAGEARDDEPIAVREETADDYAGISELTAAAHGGDASLAQLMRQSETFIPELSLVAEQDGVLVGHIIFAGLSLGEDMRIAALASISVLPGHRTRAVRCALIDKAREISADIGYSIRLPAV